ncbi:MAG: amidohydrolase [Oscillospiraceae bacterium]|jgi:amidohydrolase|nr:amidohydrolase [Oscillospiraceae bacterium]
MSVQSIKSKLTDKIKALEPVFLNLNTALNKMPELGFKEEKTAEFVRRFLCEHFPEAHIEHGIALTGIRATVPCGNPQGINLALLCELDAVITPGHPDADPVTGAAHSCGHATQIAVMLGLMLALKQSGVMDDLCGSVTFLAVPAEEYVELEYRQNLRKTGRVTYLSGKQEFVRLGVLDDVDILMMAHAQPQADKGVFFVDGGSLGFTAKIVRFTGKESHAGASPHEGVNALNAATAAMMCIHCNRETFRDEDHIRVHPIITAGGDLVNIVPAHVTMETFVRGKTKEAIESACEKVDRSIAAGCLAVGATGLIENIPGYLPMRQDKTLSTLFAQNAETLPGAVNVVWNRDMPGSSDIGDLSYLMPVIQPTVGGYRGEAHAAEFCMTDPETTLFHTAAAIGMTCVDLLADNSALGQKVAEQFSPLLTKEGYLEYLDGAFELKSVP